MRNKAQTAMEYLMTYGWAILIVIVVIAALYAMGVFTPQAAGGSCSPCFSNFAFVDYAGGSLILTTQPREITITGITEDGGAGPSLASGCTLNVACEASTNMQIDGITATGVHTIEITYDVTGGLTGHTDSGKIHN